MSKSLKRVTRTLREAGLTGDPVETGPAQTARMAADALGCKIDQIAKSIIFAGAESGAVLLFVTAGGNQVDPARASALAGEALTKADAGAIRAQTGFAIGGVAPLGHIHPVRAFFDPALMAFDVVWAAAGTPRHVFGAAPGDILRLSGATLAEFAAPG